MDAALRAGLYLKREFVPQPTDFLCFAKESQQRKATRARGQSCGLTALCFSTVRAGPETRVGCAAAQTTVPDGSLTACDARRA